ncbi:hypothetical protein ACFLRN_01595 [Thermoproteota archaeon]
MNIRINNTILKICSVLAANNEMAQYDIPLKIGKHQTTVMRQLVKLEEQGIVEFLRTERSAKKGKDKKIFALTFKGILLYLTQSNKTDSIEVIKILESNGKRLNYPLFENAKTLADTWGWMDIPSFFVICAKNLIGNPTFTKLEHFTQIMSKSKLQSKHSNMEKIFQIEDQFLKDNFFLEVLDWFSRYNKVPNQELKSFTEQLFQRKKGEFSKVKKILDTGLVLFNT